MKKITILIAAIALVCFSVPAMAVDWNFYGSARMATYYTSSDFGDSLNPAGTSTEDSELDWDLQGNSRFGANVQADHLKGQIEMGISESNVSARRVYGTWNFGAGYLKVGKDYTPVDQFISGQVYEIDLGLLGVGTQYGGRQGQIALGFGNFEIALVNPTTKLLNNMTINTTSIITVPGQPGQGPITGPVVSANATNGDPDQILPQISAKWGMAFDAWNFNLMGGYQYYSIEDVQSSIAGQGTDDLDITSYTIGGDIGFNFGPAVIKGAVSYGQNIGNAGWGLPGERYTGQGGLAEWDGDDDTNDTYTAMAALVGGFKLSDMWAFEAGFGYRKDQTDGGVSRDTAPWSAYLQSVITLAPGVNIIPEVGYFDYDNNSDGDDAGSTFYVGGKWQIDF
jgi:hypothetical protein